MSKATADLMKEHEVILTALRILERMVAGSERDGKVNISDMVDFTNFLKEFADKCHHGKEEGLLFPAMVAAGTPEKGGPIGMMLQEHIEGRKLVKEMAGGLVGRVNVGRLNQAARSYIFLLRNHIQKENMVLFPLADRVLNEQILADLYLGFEEYEEKVIGHGRHEELYAILDKLKSKYPG
jgi:hemerythrin-like domain-containing protein